MAGDKSEELRGGALAYHRLPRPGKLEIQPTKPLGNQHDLALAYTPGVAAACEAIVADPSEAAHLTIRANLVGVVSNGTAVLGLGNIGPLASKPVMEGKAVLFKKFAGIDVFDIEIAANDVPRMVEVIAALEPTFGGMLRALSLGAPPHGGIAPGIDRIVMLLCAEENLREIVLFPMNQRAEDLLMGAPSEVTPKQLRELHIRLNLPAKAE